MARSDEDLLDFDKGRLADWDDDRASHQLDEQPDLYRSHLLIARWVADWAERLEEDREADPENKGFCKGLREVAAHLRQGDFIPGRPLYEEEVNGR